MKSSYYATKRKKFIKYLESLYVEPEKKISLEKDYPSDFDQKMIEKAEGQKILAEGIKNLAVMQDKLYAHDQYSMLIVLQVMDAAGKDGAIKHVMSGLNPQGVKVTSFKTPSKIELDHDYFWRHYAALPSRGEIGIFNHIDRKFWEQRYKQIRRFEKNLYENGTIILKFFLHVSREEQKKRFLERIDNPAKNWKFSVAYAQERQHWNKYMEAYEEMLNATSQKHALWFVVPADDKWFTRLCLAAIIYFQFERLRLSYPIVSKEQKAKLLEAKKQLLGERK